MNNKVQSRQGLGRTGKHAVLVLLAVLTAACGSMANSQPAVSTLYQSSQCGDLDPGIHLLEDQAAFDRIYRNRGVIPLDGEDGPPRADFDNRHVLLIAQGQRGTAGYSIRLLGDSATVRNDTVELPVIFEAPIGEARAQVMTSPCLVLTLQMNGFSRIRAGDYELVLD